MTDRAAEKAAVRAAAFAVRAAALAGAPEAPRAVAAHVSALVRGLPAVRRVAGYMPIRSELDPLPTMTALAAAGVVLCLPVVTGRAQPLAFRDWAPGAALEPGAFGVPVPADGAPVVPDALLVPMLAFDARGHRLGYGGGFYDRTIAALRAGPGVLALGLAFAAQEVAALPDAGTDMVLDAIATERGVMRYSAAS